MRTFLGRNAVLWLLALGLMLPLGSRPSVAFEDMDVMTYRRDVQDLTKRIDELIAARWLAEGITPAPIADDAEFLRRVSLDLTGKIPAASTVRDFLANQSPSKRADLVEKLLASPSYVIHYTNLWRDAMIPEAESDAEIRFVLPGFESWLRSRIAANRNFAEIVEEMLTVPVSVEDTQGFQRTTSATPVAFYRAKGGKPERLAAATSRLFLGVRLDCAECHDHPFDHWKQPQFWEQAAFFADVDFSNPTKMEAGSIRIPEKNQLVSARFLGASAPADATPDYRAALAKWIVSADNPYFARAAVNRIWSYHFGIGLVEPMDDFSDHNLPSHPELLDALAEAFVAHNYDFKFLIRAITASQAYQLTSRQTDPSQQAPTRFARMAVRGLTPEQTFDTLAQATGYRQPFNPEEPLNFNNDAARQEFLATFSNQNESAVDRTATILQALSLMNGRFVSEATDVQNSRTLTAVVESRFLTSDEKIDALLLTTLSRLPSDAERLRMQSLLQSVPVEDQPAALADLFWVLLNSSEFLLNH